MSSPTVDRARQLAAQLVGAGLAATHDARAVAGMAPCVLIGPPRLSFDVGTSATASWRLLAVAASADPLSAWEQLDNLVAAVAVVLSVETADPTQFAPNADSDPLPAYALTLTD